MRRVLHVLAVANPQRLWLVLAIWMILACGCTKPKPIRESGADIFRDCTGLPLPGGAECLNAKTNTVFLVGDIYYLKLAAPNGFSKFLDANFELCAEADKSLVPPRDWMKDLPFWDEAEIARANRFYTKTLGPPETRMFVSAIAYNEATNIAYFQGAECP
jgi:hypothetical protein